MKYILSILMASVIVQTAICQANKSIAIIPEPVDMKVKSGQFMLTANSSISAPADAAFALNFLQQQLRKAAGFKLKQVTTGGQIRMSLNTVRDNTLGKEGYRLTVLPQQINIIANDAGGLFYAVQTLLQLLPKEIESQEVVGNTKWTIPCVDITDYPRFAWRGLMLDVSRHFFTKAEVKQFIDDMVRYKFNLLHWHLTDDEGWRVEIKSLPKLTQVGAWNVKRVGHFGEFQNIRDDEPRTYGGFYTQEDIKEIVQYAKEHFVNVLPEIDVPGHSMAAIVSYPELSCTEGADKYKVISGEKFIEWPASGHFYGLVDNTLCPANEKVYPFLDKVFTELAQLFPFEYIHVGGDECIQNFWEKSDAVKALMQRENLKSMIEVQGYFENRLEKIIGSKGKKMIGWDEILEAGVSPSAAIMSWRGTKGGVEASQKGHEVVMSPTTYAYLDYMQADEIMEPRIYASLRLNKTYSYEPVSEGINEKLIKGVQGNLWTEQVYNYRQVQYMVWPRAFAISETGWSPGKKKNWNSFVAKIENHFNRYDVAEKKYAPSMYDVDFKATLKDDALTVTLTPEIDGLDIYYSFDNTYPDRFYPKYTAPLQVPQDATLLRVITYRGKKPIGRMNNMPVDVLRKRAAGK